MNENQPNHDPILDHLNLLLERIKRWELQDGSDLFQLSESRIPHEQLKASSVINALESSTLKDLVVADQRFPGSSTLFISHVEGGGGTGFYPDFIVGPTIRRLLRSRDAGQTIAWLEKVLTTKRANGWRYTLLMNIWVDDPVALTDAIDLVPVSTLPEHPIKEWIIRDLPRVILENPFSFINPNPRVAVLRERVLIEPFLYNGETHHGPPKNRSGHSYLYDVALLLTLVGPSPVASVATWGMYSDPDLQEALFGSSRIGHSNEIISAESGDSVHIEAGDAKLADLVKRYTGAETKTKDRIKVALSRLNQGLRRLNVGDAAVELSIAFEALVGDNQKTEMTNKVKVRSVRMLAGTADKRSSNASLFNAIYEMRSSLVHSGKTSQKTIDLDGQKVTGKEIVRLGGRMCADLIREFISVGKTPDWQMFDIMEHSNRDSQVT